jgi:hypothetical protein
MLLLVTIDIQLSLLLKDISGAIPVVDLPTNGQDSSMATPHHTTWL